VIMESIITCPACGVAKAEVMPTDACECTGCGTLLRPKCGDCCSVPCSPIQASNGEPLCRQKRGKQHDDRHKAGVHRPDWSVVTKPSARDALYALLRLHRSQPGAIGCPAW